MSDEQETITIPVLELEYSKLLELCQRINIIDTLTYISMPNHVDAYASKDKTSIAALVDELVGYESKEENKWRIERKPAVDIKVSKDSFAFGERVIYDAKRIIVISQMNSVYIIPGERSIKEGRCKPNEIIKFTNLVSSQYFLLKFDDVPKENNDGYDLKVSFMIVESNKNNES